MRISTFVFLATVALGCVSTSISSAAAADLDYDVLRGADEDLPPPVPVIDWSGVYVGGHGGYTSAAYGFRNVFHEMIFNELHDTSAESIFGISSLLHAGPARIEGGSFGAFAGYNFQFDDFVIGVEADYTHFGRIGGSSDSFSVAKVRDDGIVETVALSGASTTRLRDYGTIRARVGYALGSFLPFVTGGAAIGQALVTDKVTYRDYGFDQTAYKANVSANTTSNYYHFGYSSFDPTNPYGSTPYTTTIPARTTIKTVGGFALGAGLEYALTSNVLLRGEYQYVYFNDFNGHTVNLNTVRGGLALKF